jgi:hypothetical protein
MKGRVLRSVALASIIGLAAAQPALAYIDPNTGGMLFQILAVAFASVSAIVLIFSRQVRMLFARAMRALRGLFGAQPEPVEPSSDASSDSGKQPGISAEPPDQSG